MIWKRLGFVSYLHGLCLSNHKRHSYNGYFMYMPSFNQFLQMVYFDLVLSCLMQIIGHNPVNFIGFQRFILMSPFMCSMFQLDQSMYSDLMADFVRNKGEN